MTLDGFHMVSPRHSPQNVYPPQNQRLNTSEHTVDLLPQERMEIFHPPKCQSIFVKWVVQPPHRTDIWIDPNKKSTTSWIGRFP